MKHILMPFVTNVFLQHFWRTDNNKNITGVFSFHCSLQLCHYHSWMKTVVVVSYFPSVLKNIVTLSLKIILKTTWLNRCLKPTVITNDRFFLIYNPSSYPYFFVPSVWWLLDHIRYNMYKNPYPHGIITETIYGLTHKTYYFAVPQW
jgi:hypothetical protein